MVSALVAIAKRVARSLILAVTESRRLSMHDDAILWDKSHYSQPKLIVPAKSLYCSSGISASSSDSSLEVDDKIFSHSVCVTFPNSLAPSPPVSSSGRGS